MADRFSLYGNKMPPFPLSMDPEHVRLRSEKAKAHEERRRMLEKDEASLVADLKSTSWPVNSAWFFVNRGADDYQEVFPVLLKHLWLPHNPRTTEGIVRSLTVKSACGEVAKHIVAWAKMRPDLAVAELAFPIWNCLNVVADRSMAEDVIVLRNDARFESETARFDKLIAKLTRQRPSRAEGKGC